MNFNDILGGIKGLFGKQDIVRPVEPANPNSFRVMLDQQQRAPRNTPTAIPAPSNAPQGVLGASTGPESAPKRALPPITEEQIQRGWDGYGNGDAPAATMSAVFADVANQYPRLKENPGLLPSMAMKESSGGKANTKNWFNWGMYDDHYQEGNPEQVIRDVAEAIGSDKGNSSHYYEDFRESGDIMDMLNRYAPPSENDTNLYHDQLLEWMKMFSSPQQPPQ